MAILWNPVGGGRGVIGRPLSAREHAVEPVTAGPNDFADALLNGLRSDPKRVPCKYFYDAEGSRLFEKICGLAEYYPSRTEVGLLRRHSGEIAQLIGPDAEIIEFGAGSSDKIRVLLDALHPRAYLPVDISGTYLRTIARQLGTDYPDLAVQPIVADFTQPLSWQPFTRGKRVGFFPGSTIGNFEPDGARTFLARTAKLLKGSGLLIGVDLVKDPATLHAAYNDGAGITAGFNKNILARANRETGSNFDLARFAHYALYNPLYRRIEMYLVSTTAQRVIVCGCQIDFDEGEAIHTEFSYKYTLDGFRRLAASAGYFQKKVWCDDERLFSVHWLEAA
jgi:dimethylhistidine N-methyltransferase